MKALGRLVIVKATRGGGGGGGDTILYTQHATKIDSLNGQGEVDYIYILMRNISSPPPRNIPPPKRKCCGPDPPPN